MAGAWGKSWGVAFGASWGLDEAENRDLSIHQALTAAAPRTRMRITPKVLPYPQAKPQHRTRAAREKEFPVIAV
jgi:hypothetical protein